MQLNYTEQGTGEPVFLIHGLLGSLTNLGNLARALAPNYRVISVDLRNHGDSPHLQEMSLPSMALDIADLMDDLSIASGHFVGHSLGGKVAMQLALSDSVKVDSLVVADIAPVKYKEKNTNEINALYNLSKVIIKDRKTADTLLADYGIASSVSGFLLKNLRRNSDGNFELKLNITAIKECYKNHLLVAPKGENFAGPCLFFKGENSSYIEPHHIPMIQSLFTQSALHTVKDAGHWLHADKPDYFNQLVLQFINEIS